MNSDLLPEKTEKASVLYMICIGMASLGFQVAYAVVFALVDPIMTSLEMSDFAKFISWSLGPVSGFILQPMMGYFSDRTRSKLGRRRPFIIGGGVCSAIGITGLYLLKTYSYKFSQTAKTVLLMTTVFLTYVAINAIQGSARPLIGDVLPQEQQDLGFTIASILIGIGNIATNLIGGIGYFLDKSYQDHTLTITLLVCNAIVFVSLLITIFTAKEKQFTGEIEDTNVFKKLFHAVTHMSKPMARACFLLTLSWVAFYPFVIKVTSFFSTEVFPAGEENKGLCFGLFVTAVASVVTTLYGFVNVYLMNCIGLKATYALSHFIMGISFIAILFTKNRWVLLALFAPVGMTITVFNSIPYSITSASSSKEDVGVNLGALNILLVIGQQIANLINMLIGYIHDHWKWLSQHYGKNECYISFGAVAAIITGFASFSLIIPGSKEDEEAKSKLSYQSLT